MYLGMPYPQNLETAKEVEAIVRQNGAVPATIAILDGVPCIGEYSTYCVLALVVFVFQLLFHRKIGVCHK